MRLIDVFPRWATGGGIFTGLDSAPWSESVKTPLSLDIAYFGNRSGYKEVSPLLDKFCCYPFALEVSDENRQRILNVIEDVYMTDWTKLWEALQLEYNPISNYDSTEERTGWQQYGNTIEHQRGTTETTSGKAKSKNETKSTDSVKAINSSDFADVSHAEGESTTEQFKADNESEVKRTGSDTDKHTGQDDDYYKLTRKGNIGVTTTQQMLESEYELRKRHYFEQVFDDLDNLLTSPIWR